MDRLWLFSVIAASLSFAHAQCPNYCSGHGMCDTAGGSEQCLCYKGWMDADCSERECPFEIAWTDEPDHDGEWHNYAECANRGICDRELGECVCFEGYTGKTCQRETCPNDCSGHGTCEYIEDLQYNAHGPNGRAEVGISADARTVNFGYLVEENWAHRHYMGCKCDPGYTEFDCSRRMCPRSNDVQDERLNVDDTFKYQVQNVTLLSGGPKGDGHGSSVTDFLTGSFALTFISLLNETYTTLPLRVDSSLSSSWEGMEKALADDIEDALYALPNKVVDKVNVNVTFAYETRMSHDDTRGTNYDKYIDEVAAMIIELEMSGNNLHGTQNLIAVEAEECLYPGCSPMLDGLNLVVHNGGTGNQTFGKRSFVSEKQSADHNSYECGRRGKCDYSSGLCSCYEGFTGASCEIQTALA